MPFSLPPALDWMPLGTACEWIVVDWMHRQRNKAL